MLINLDSGFKEAFMSHMKQTPEACINMQTDENLMSQGQKFDLEEVKENYLSMYDKQLNNNNGNE